MPWRSRRREEPRQPSASQSDFNSIRVNTADYRSLGLLRQYDDQRINASSISQPTSERDHRLNSSDTNELERCPSDNPNPSQERHSRRRPSECLFLTSGYRVSAKGSSSVQDFFPPSKDASNEYEDGMLPFPEQSGEGFLLRRKWCLMSLFLVFAFGAVIGLSLYLRTHGSMKASSVHAFVNANPVARLLGFLGGSDTSADARSMWINHVVKNDDNQILIAETFESRLNAEITPLLEKHTIKIWEGGSSSSPFTCHGEDRVMMAFSVAKAGSMPASITYETPCMVGPSSRSCVVKKQVSDARDLVVRLPSKSSRYMHAVHVEIDHNSKDHQGNNSEVRYVQDLGTIGGQFRVELSDAASLALQRYCGQNKRAYSEDLVTELVSERNTRLINVYELKRLYALLSNHSDVHVSRSRAWDTRMLSTVVIDPLEHSRHSLAPIHVQQLLAQIRGTDMKAPHTSYDSRSPHISASIPREGDQPPLPTRSSSPPSEAKEHIESNESTSRKKTNPDLSSPSFNFQPPPASSPPATEKSMNNSSDDSNDGSNGENGHGAASEAPSSPADEQDPDDVDSDSTEDTTTTQEEDKEKDAEQESSGSKSVIKHKKVAPGTGSVLRKFEESGAQTITTRKTGVSKGDESVQPSDLSNGFINSSKRKESPSLLREEDRWRGSAFARNSSLADTKIRNKNAPVPSETSSHVFPSRTDRYGEIPPSPQKLDVPATLQPDTMTAKPSESLESQPSLLEPHSRGTNRQGAGLSSFAKTFTERSSPSGQDSKVESSFHVPPIHSWPSSSTVQLPAYKQGARFPSENPSSSNAQDMFASPGQQYALTKGISSVSPSVVKNFPQTHQSAISGGAPSSSSTLGVLHSISSSSGPANTLKTENSLGATPIARSQGQTVLPRKVARAQVVSANAHRYEQYSRMAKTAGGAALRGNPISVTSVIDREIQERPVD